MYDCIIANARILDGTGAPEQYADVGIKDGRIAALADLKGEHAAKRLDAETRIVCPGFIDMHSHDDFNLPVNPHCAEKTQQGVTLQVTGNCGFSPAPVIGPAANGSGNGFADFVSFLDSGLDWEWRSFGQFIERLPALGLNIAQLVGHVTVRYAVMGAENRAPRSREMEAMRAHVADAMQAGAFGFSSGLMYIPSAFASTGEVIELARVAARYGGAYHTHIRNMGREVFAAVEEAIEIGAKAESRVQISHMKINHRALWGRAAELMEPVERARLAGQPVCCDIYPYTAGSGGLKNSLPYWVQEGGIMALLSRLRDTSIRNRIRTEVLDAMAQRSYHISEWSDVLIGYSPAHPQFHGLNLLQIAARQDRAPVDAYLDLIESDKGATVSVHFMMNEEDVHTFMRHPAMSIGSDGIFRGVAGKPDPGSPHPRHFGTFPRILGHYTRDEQIFELPEAIRKMTSANADILGLKDRGRLAPGAIADIVVFDPNTVSDTATYTEPQQPPVGIEHVFVNGTPVISGGVLTGATPGGVLKKNNLQKPFFA